VTRWQAARVPRLEREVWPGGRGRSGAVVHAAQEQARPEGAHLAQDGMERQRVLRHVVVEPHAGAAAVDGRAGVDTERRERALEATHTPHVRSVRSRKPLATPDAGGPTPPGRAARPPPR